MHTCTESNNEKKIFHEDNFQKNCRILTFTDITAFLLYVQEVLTIWYIVSSKPCKLDKTSWTLLKKKYLFFWTVYSSYYVLWFITIHYILYTLKASYSIRKRNTNALKMSNSLNNVHSKYTDVIGSYNVWRKRDL